MVSSMTGLWGAFAALLLGAGFSVGAFVACTGEGGDVDQGDAGPGDASQSDAGPGDASQSDASDIDLVCPPEKPDYTRACKSGLSCSYGDHVDCLCNGGYPLVYKCVDGSWGGLVDDGDCPSCPTICDDSQLYGTPCTVEGASCQTLMRCSDGQGYSVDLFCENGVWLVSAPYDNCGCPAELQPGASCSSSEGYPYVGPEQCVTSELCPDGINTVKMNIHCQSSENGDNYVSLPLGTCPPLPDGGAGGADGGA